MVDQFYNLSDYEKEINLEKKFYDYSLEKLIEYMDINNFDDDRVYNRTKYNIISNMSILSKNKIELLKKIFNIDLLMIKDLVDKINIDISNLLDFEYDIKNEKYIIRKNSLCYIISSLNNIDEIKNVIKIWQENRDRIYFKNYSSNFKYVDLINYKEKEYAYYDKLFKNSTSLSEKKDIFFKKYYNIELEAFRKIIKKYNVNGFINYLKKEYRPLIELYKCDNIDELNSKYISWQEDNNIMEEISSNFVALCCDNITDTVNNFTFPDNYEIKNGVKIFDISDTKFNLLIHRTNAVSNNIKINPLDWNSYNIIGKTTISCFGISNLFLGRVEEDEEEKSIYFGFNSINSEDIIDMGPQNINMSDMIKDNMPNSKYGRNFMKFDEMMNNSFDQYNEIALFRFNQITGEKIKPNYIICFDKIHEYELSFADKMNLPIVYVDTEKVYKRTRDSLNDLINNPKVYENIEINFRTAKKILAFAYGAYCSGRLEIDVNSLNNFLKNTQNSHLSKEYKKFIYNYCIQKNNSLILSLGDKYIISRQF